MDTTDDVLTGGPFFRRQRLEIGPDVIRWSLRRQVRTIDRDDVVTAHARTRWLHVKPAVRGSGLVEVSLLPFDRSEVQAALERHGWTTLPDPNRRRRRPRSTPAPATRGLRLARKAGFAAGRLWRAVDRA